MTTMATEAVRYTGAICKGSALLAETKTLLRAWRPGEPIADFRQRVLREDLLGRRTAYRANDIINRVFARRYLRPDARPALALKKLLEAGQSGQQFSDLCLLYAARNDKLMRDVVTELYWPALSERRLAMSPSYVVEFLRQAERDGRIEEPWSEQVKVKIARGVLKALADFGLMREIGRGRRELVQFRPTDRAVVYVAYDLHFSSLTDAGVVEHEDWRLYGLMPMDVTSTLDRLSGEGWWLAQTAGSLTRISWKYSTMEDVVNALTR